MPKEYYNLNYEDNKIVVIKPRDHLGLNPGEESKFSLSYSLKELLEMKD